MDCWRGGSARELAAAGKICSFLEWLADWLASWRAELASWLAAG